MPAKKVKSDSVTRETVSVLPKYWLFSAQTYERLRAIHFALYGIVKRVLDFVMAAAMILVLRNLCYPTHFKFIIFNIIILILTYNT